MNENNGNNNQNGYPDYNHDYNSDNFLENQGNQVDLNNNYTSMNDFPGYNQNNNTYNSNIQNYNEAAINNYNSQSNVGYQQYGETNNQSNYQDTNQYTQNGNGYEKYDEANNQMYGPNNVISPTKADAAKIEEIFNKKSKNEKLGLYGIIAMALIILGGVVYGIISGDEFYIIGFPLLFGLVLIIFLVIYLIALSKRKKMVKRPDINVVKSELLSDNVFVFDSAGVYMTQNYIVSHGVFSNILKYSEIALIYNERVITNARGARIDNGIFMIAFLVSGKRVNILRTYDEDELQMIGRVLKERNPNILFGLNKENKEKLKQIKKNYKSTKNA